MRRIGTVRKSWNARMESRQEIVKKTDFQIDCEETLNSIMGQHGRRLDHREESVVDNFGKPMIMLSVRIGILRVWIYGDQVDIVSEDKTIDHVMEALDFRDTKEQLRAFAGHLNALLAEGKDRA